MRTYRFHAITQAGDRVLDTIEAESVSHAEELISTKGLILASDISIARPDIKEQIEQFFISSLKIKPEELILFSKQFRTMFSVGLPILQLLEVLEKQTENKRLKHIVATMGADIKSGVQLSSAFNKHPDVFNKLYCSMIQAGESSGRLPEVLDRLITIISHEQKVKKDIKSAMTYPVIVLVALVVAFFSLITFVVPQFATMFEKSGAALPWQTQICLTLHSFIEQWWQFMLIGTVGLFAGLIFWIRTPNGRYWRDRVILHIPIIGMVLKKSAMSRFASIFAILQSSGVNVLDAVDILEGTIGNEAIARDFNTLKTQLQQGSGISAPLRQSKYFTPMVVNMVAIGEETGQLDNMLSETAKHYDYEVSYAISRMTEMLGPMLIACMAGLIGFFALAIFLPMWEMSSAMGL